MGQVVKSVILEDPQDSPFEGIADAILQTKKTLESKYWELHEETSKAAYVSSQEAMEDAQRLGQLAQAIALLSSAQAKLRCINSVNVI